MTSIQWTEQTWNPTTGCDRVSDGCLNCYALTMAKRLKGMGAAKYQNDGNPKTSGLGFGITMHPDVLDEPWHWKKPRRVFVNSMSDLFHAGVTDEFIARVFAVMALTPRHTYQILTKRHARMRSLLNRPDFADMIRSEMVAEVGAYTTLARSGSWSLPLRNVYLGVSVENQKWADIRIKALAQTPAAVRFLSCEPLLGPVRLPLTELVDGPGPAHSIDWVIIGGESGPGARPFQTQWAADLINDTRRLGAAPFVKQLGSVWARENHASDSKGGNSEDWPTELRVREYPEPR
ncbi:phage Gp37/Gp68 family protein [Streptomyces sp. ML-6]|uniref:DUF5131 family protein n=1 Tax=Streptomyces sp. ML-6 TaxID=2982693 RepID=UPI0024BF9895|nr:phage Gp37/Gp68 family protein [Streptomyces sp. ML-6]MDK0525060.1 phage Gp37/Gp68 family protein [Streptomyces sp. ML-6]